MLGSIGFGYFRIIGIRGQREMKRMLVLNVELSGINRYLFRELVKKGWDYEVIEMGIPERYRYWAIATTFRPDMNSWRQDFRLKLGKIVKSARAFKWRSRLCEERIRRAKNQLNIIFQISGMFSPTLDYEQLQAPFVTFTDYTMALSEKYPDWLPWPSEVGRWIDLERELYQNAKLNFVWSENTRRSFIGDYGVPAERVVNVGCGVPLDDIPDTRKTNGGKTILYVGFEF